MTKGRSSNSDKPRESFGLPKSAILRGRKNFQRLFEYDVIVFRTKYINFRFRLYKDTCNDLRVGFIVRKKLGKAVHRNHIKRLMRESYRLNQHILHDAMIPSAYSLHGVFMANMISMDFSHAQNAVVELLHETRDYILPMINSDS